MILHTFIQENILDISYTTLNNFSLRTYPIIILWFILKEKTLEMKRLLFGLTNDKLLVFSLYCRVLSSDNLDTMRKFLWLKAIHIYFVKLT